MIDTVQQLTRDGLVWLTNRISDDTVADAVFVAGVLITDRVFTGLERLGL